MAAAMVVRENVIASVIGCGEPVAKSSKEHGYLWRWQCRREDDRPWRLVSGRRGGSTGALEEWQDLMVWKMIEGEMLPS